MNGYLPSRQEGALQASEQDIDRADLAPFCFSGCLLFFLKDGSLKNSPILAVVDFFWNKSRINAKQSNTIMVSC